MTTYETIIVGLGAMGSAAAYQLSRRGNRVLGIDRFAPPHDRGSTHGEVRVTRQAIGEGAAYTPLALRSHEIWRELEALSGVSLFTASGLLIMSQSVSGGAIHGSAGFLEETLKSGEAYGIAGERLGGEEIRRRYPQFKAGCVHQGYFEPGGGFVRPERCVEVQLGLAAVRGAEIHTRETVVDFAPTGTGGVRVRTNRGEYVADRLILSAGAWMGGLLGARFEPLMRVYRQAQFWFAVDDAAAFSPERFPVFIWDLGISEESWIYGFPVVDGSVGGIKIAREDYSATTSPETVERSVGEGERRRMYEEWVEPYLDGVSSRCLRASACLYTVTPDSDFIIDRHPEWPQVIVASPCSGHGFKHSAAIGEILAEMAIGGESRLDALGFGLGRFSS